MQKKTLDDYWRDFTGEILANFKVNEYDLDCYRLMFSMGAIALSCAFEENKGSTYAELVDLVNEYKEQAGLIAKEIYEKY